MNFLQKLKKMKAEKWYDRERIPALDNALKKAVDRNQYLDWHFRNPLTNMSEKFLGCEESDFYLLGATFPKEVDIFMARLLERIIRENYKSYNEEMMKYLKSVIGETGFKKSYQDYLNKQVGMNYRCFSSAEGELIDYIGSGNYFMQDSNGMKIVISINNNLIMNNESRGGALLINVFANSSIEGARKACCDFIDTVNRELGTDIKGTTYAMGARGYPIKVGSQSWDDLKIPEALKKDIRFHIMDFIKHIDRFKEAGIRPSRGIIISGSPGNGKTMLGRILCSNINIPFFYASSSDFQQVMGGPKIEQLYNTASTFAPSIVFIEDADIFLQNRQFNMNSGTLTDFLNLIDGLKENNGVITIMTCNNPELIDEAVKNRPKRFDVIIEFPNPALEQRMEILLVKLEKHIDASGLKHLAEAAAKMDGFSGAHLTEFAERMILSKIYSNKEMIDSEIIFNELECFGFKKHEVSVIGIR